MMYTMLLLATLELFLNQALRSDIKCQQTYICTLVFEWSLQKHSNAQCRFFIYKDVYLRLSNTVKKISHANFNLFYIILEYSLILPTAENL